MHFLLCKQACSEPEKTRVSASSLIVQIPKSGGVGAPPQKLSAYLKASIAFRLHRDEMDRLFK
jgi:hypothetical protein